MKLTIPIKWSKWFESFGIWMRRAPLMHSLMCKFCRLTIREIFLSKATRKENGFSGDVVIFSIDASLAVVFVSLFWENSVDSCKIYM